ncbi:DNA internalization-related competence protein ComEC/Rec2 [Solimicrobium silvestre]|uniref:DNA internalization-related competence protein ComEC/Rec2 n=1 Tax=Solimicrobium silvestre TaxID=2099400 RepID=A0A2S9GZT9_9BURK|nr:DNA internalization-related competence protein ComEC/Rec2 [Solimicrobium silvestre]PRC93136.1 DNA internalization-related competence protein ComEC/Rec2 [Solimicrobium silvestre]
MRSTIIGFVLGVLLLQQQRSLWEWPALAALICVAVLIFLSLRWVHRAALCNLFMLLVGGLSGWVWASGFAIVALSTRLAPEIEEQDIAVVGVISSLPSQSDYGQRFQFSIERVLTPNVNSAHMPDKVLLSWYEANSFQRSNPQVKTQSTTPLQAGERWQLNVRLRRPHGLANPYGFDYEVWLLEQGLDATGTVRNDRNNAIKNQQLNSFAFSVKNCIEWARGKLRNRILSALPNQPYAPVLVALVIGEQGAIRQSDWQVFARTGISHLISISGLHVTMLSGMCANLMFYLWRKSFFTRYQLPLILPAHKAAALSGFLMALIYVALAGFGVPAQRTLIMIAVLALALWMDRVTSVSNVLCLALALVLLVDPWAVLWPGFWLSFSAVGIIFFVSLGRREMKAVEQFSLSPKPSIRASKFFQHIRQASTIQYAITLGLVPLTMLLFNQVSIVSPIANAVAIPIVSLLVTPFALLGSVLPAPIGTWVLVLTNFILQYLISFLGWLSQLSWAVWQAPRPEVWMFLCAFAGTFWCLAPKGWPLRWAGLLAWLPLCLNSSNFPAPGEFKVTALDVGQGMALLIETERHRLLYDTGPSYSPESDAGSRVIYPYLKMRGINQLDGLMISHNDSDHSGGALSLMQQLKINWVASSLALDSTIVQTAQQQSQHITCLAGQSWEWDGVQFEVLHPPAVIYTSDKWKPNAKSCTLKITNGAHSLLLAGDIEAIQEDQLVNSIPEKLSATVLLAPHHGSGTSSTTEFLREVNPQLAIFQLGYHNRYRHPKSSVWQRYADFGITRLRNDDAGAITLKFGAEVSFEEYRVTDARYWHPTLSADRY